MPPLVSSAQERTILETCLAECKRRLNYFRHIGDDMQAALAEADMDRMLEELSHIYKRPFGRAPLK